MNSLFRIFALFVLITKASHAGTTCPDPNFYMDFNCTFTVHCQGAYYNAMLNNFYTSWTPYVSNYKLNACVNPQEDISLANLVPVVWRLNEPDEYISMNYAIQVCIDYANHFGAFFSLQNVSISNVSCLTARPPVKETSPPLGRPSSGYQTY